MRSKRIITLLLVMSLTLMLLSSCAETGDGLKAETTGDSTQSPETTGSNSNDTEKPEDTTGGTPETTIPEGVDIELYNAAKEALIQLDDETKKEIEKALEFRPGDFWMRADDSDFELRGELRCYGCFENCIVLFLPTALAVNTGKIIAGIEFNYSKSFVLYGYSGEKIYTLEEAYNTGFVSKDEIALAAERHKVVEEYRKSKNER